MGMFSWITQDTNESIRIIHYVKDSEKQKCQAYMHDDKGNIYFQNEYQGYGDFGGKDFFALLAEMNEELFPLAMEKRKEDVRNHLINGKTSEENAKRVIARLETLSTKITGDSEIDREHGIYLYYCKTIEGIKFPNLTRNKTWQWRNSRPASCPNQGFCD